MISSDSKPFLNLRTSFRSWLGKSTAQQHKVVSPSCKSVSLSAIQCYTYIHHKPCGNCFINQLTILNQQIEPAKIASSLNFKFSWLDHHAQLAWYPTNLHVSTSSHRYQLSSDSLVLLGDYYTWVLQGQESAPNGIIDFPSLEFYPSDGFNVEQMIVPFFGTWLLYMAISQNPDPALLDTLVTIKIAGKCMFIPPQNWEVRRGIDQSPYHVCLVQPHLHNPHSPTATSTYKPGFPPRPAGRFAHLLRFPHGCPGTLASEMITDR